MSIPKNIIHGVFSVASPNNTQGIVTLVNCLAKSDYKGIVKLDVSGTVVWTTEADEGLIRNTYNSPLNNNNISVTQNGVIRPSVDGFVYLDLSQNFTVIIFCERFLQFINTISIVGTTINPTLSVATY